MPQGPNDFKTIEQRVHYALDFNAGLSPRKPSRGKNSTVWGQVSGSEPSFDSWARYSAGQFLSGIDTPSNPEQLRQYERAAATWMYNRIAEEEGSKEAANQLLWGRSDLSDPSGLAFVADPEDLYEYLPDQYREYDSHWEGEMVDGKWVPKSYRADPNKFREWFDPETEFIFSQAESPATVKEPTVGLDEQVDSLREEARAEARSATRQLAMVETDKKAKRRNRGSTVLTRPVGGLLSEDKSGRGASSLLSGGY